MAKKNKKENKKNTREDSETSSKTRLLGELKRETKHSIFAIGAFVLGLIFILSYFDKAGVAGTLIDKIFGSLFGNGFFLLPLVLFFASFSLFYSIRPNIVSHTIIGTLIFLLSSLGAFSAIWGDYAGGYIGYFVSLPLLKFFDFSVSLIALVGIAIVSVLIMLNMPLALKSWWKKNEDDGEEINVHINKMSSVDDDANTKEEAKEKTGDKTKKITAEKKTKDKNANEEDGFLEIKTGLKKSRSSFVPPPLDLLESDRGKPSSGDIKIGR